MSPSNPALPTATRWTLVALAGDPSHPRSRAAFAELYERYSYPLFAALRRAGLDHAGAQESIQGFFLYALEHQTLARANAAKGSFRSFIRKCLDNFLHDEHRRRTAAKRGGTAPAVSFDALAAHERYAIEEVDDLTPERLYDRKFALEVLDGALSDLAEAAAAEDKSAVFAALRDHLADDGAIESLREIAARLGIPAGTLRSQLSRWRSRYRRLIRERVGDQVASDEAVTPEIAALGEAL